MSQRRAHDGEFKARVVRAALREDQTLVQLASEFQISSQQISQWKTQALEALPEVLTDKRRKEPRKEITESDLYEQIGHLKVQLDWLKKKSAPYLSLRND